MARPTRATRPYSSNADYRGITQPYTSRCTADSAPTTAITPTADSAKAIPLRGRQIAPRWSSRRIGRTHA